MSKVAPKEWDYKRLDIEYYRTHTYEAIMDAYWDGYLYDYVRVVDIMETLDVMIEQGDCECQEVMYVMEFAYEIQGVEHRECHDVFHPPENIIDRIYVN